MYLLPGGGVGSVQYVLSFPCLHTTTDTSKDRSKGRIMIWNGRHRSITGERCSLDFCSTQLYSHLNLQNIYMLGWTCKATFTPDNRPTPSNADQFLWIGRVLSGKKLPALIE